MITSFENARLSDHALLEMNRRNIEKSTVLEVLAHPENIRSISATRVVLHKIMIAQDTKKALLYRVFVDTDYSPPVVVTVYKTSKIAKYEPAQ